MAYLQGAQAAMNLSKLILSLVFLLIAINTTQADPQISFPINAQVPPVARVGTFFDFTFSANTFSDAALDLSYSISNAPSWLSINSTTRRFTGTPDQDDKGSTVFNLVATDSIGFASMPVTFVVLDTLGPRLALSTGASVFTADTLSGPESVLLSPGTTVAISLNSSIFINTNTGTRYYAVCSDNSPLPSWLIFDSLDLSFSGTAPDASSPSQLPDIYDLHVIATDVPGFSSAVFQFRLTIDLHELVFSSEQIDLNVTSGQAFNYTDLKNNLTLDGKAIDLSLITNIQAEPSSWLSIDNTTLDISGTPPQNFYAQSFWVYVQDIYGDEANTTVFLSTNASTPLFGSELPSINVTCGETVSYTLPAGTFVVDDCDSSVDLRNCSSWLTYNPRTLTFTGKVPEYWLPQVYYINLTVTKGSQSASEEILVTINKSKVPVSPPNVPISPPSNTTNGTSNSNTTIPGWPDLGPNFTRNATICTLIIPICAAFILVAVYIWHDSRKKKTPLVLPKTQVQPSETASRYRLQSLDRSPVAFDEDWYPGFNEPPAASGSRDRQGAPKSSAKHPNSSILSSVVQKAKPKKQRAAPLVSTYNIGFGHGGITLQNHSAAPNQKPKHVPIRIPSRAYLLNNDSNERLTSPNDSYETIDSAGEPVQPSSPLDDDKMVHTQNNRSLRRSSRTVNRITIREVAKSPTPSEFPSPDLNSSPRTKLQSYVHERAGERKTSGLFSSASTQRITEKGMIVPAQKSRNTSLNVNGYSLTASAPHRPVRFSSQLVGNSASSSAVKSPATITNYPDKDPFYTRPSSVQPGIKSNAAKESKKVSFDDNSLSAEDSSWTSDGIDENAKPSPLVWHTGSSQALSYLASPSVIVDPAHGTRTMIRGHKVVQSDDSLASHGSSTQPAGPYEKLPNKSQRGDTAFP